MKYLIISIIVCTILFFNLSNFVFCEDGSAHLGEKAGRYIATNPINGNLAIGIPDGVNSEIVITDDNLGEVTRIPFSKWPYIYDYSKDGTKLYVGIWDVDQDPEHELGSLFVIDTTNWTTLRTIDLPSYPTELYIPSEQDIVYITCSSGPPHRKIAIIKINAGPSSGVLNGIEFGQAPSGGMCLNHDENKLYVDLNNSIPNFGKSGSSEIGDYSTKILIIDAATFDDVGIIKTNVDIRDIKQGPYGFLFVAHSSTDINKVGLDSTITVIDTSDDTIDRKIVIPPNIGCRELRYDSSHNYFYACPLIEINEFVPSLGYDISKRITTDSCIRINLTDDSITWIPVAPENIGAIGLSLNFSRLYVGPSLVQSGTFYYVDL
jgi:hypothetical protein